MKAPACWAKTSCVLWGKVALAAVWGGLLALERKAFLQAMLSRPLVAATGMGLLLGDVTSGLYVGVLLELFHLGAASLGAAVAEHDTLAATGTAAAAAAIVLAEGGTSTPAIWALAILLFAGLGVLGRALDRRLEGHTARLAQTAIARAERGDLNGAVRLNLFGMWPHFVVFGGITGACAAAGFALAPLFARLPLSADRALAWTYPAMASVAAAVAARGSHAKHAALWAGAVGGLVAVVGELWLARVGI